MIIKTGESANALSPVLFLIQRIRADTQHPRDGVQLDIRHRAGVVLDPRDRAAAYVHALQLQLIG